MRVLLIGYGSIGKRHAEVLRILRPEAEIHLVTRRSDVGLPAFHNLAAVPDPRAYDYYVIASETWRHHGDLEFLLGTVSGKTILVEKPLFESLRPADPGSNIVLVAYNLRFHPVIASIKEELRGERILYANAQVGQYLPTWRPDADYRSGYSASRERGGGALLDLSHEIDYANWLFGPLVTLAGLATKVSDLEIDSDDLATGFLRSTGGAVVSLSMDYLSRIPFRRIIVHTARKTIQADLLENSICVGAEGPARKVVYPGVERNHSMLAMHRAALEEGGGDCCTLEEGLTVLKLAEGFKGGENR